MAVTSPHLPFDSPVDIRAKAPPTEGIKYAGSKLRLLPYIVHLVQTVNPRTILDGFSGTTRVSQSLARCGYQVIANDLSVWSETFGKCYLLNPYPSAHYQPLIAHLNALPGEDGWFTEHYGGEVNGSCVKSLDGFKKPWQKHNTRKLDAIRAEIDRLCLSDVERAVLLTSLVLALDEVDNTLGHFTSYLHTWSPRSYRTLHLQVPQLVLSRQKHAVYRRDIFDLLPDVEVDLAYFDPPYGSNNEKMPSSRIRYAAYYHLWTTVCLNDRPALFGRARRRADTSDRVAYSVFEEFRRNERGHFVAVEAMARLLSEVRARYVLLSYSSGGRAPASELHNIISRAGKVIALTEVDYRKNVMSGMRWTHEWTRHAETPHREFLFLVEK